LELANKVYILTIIILITARSKCYGRFINKKLNKMKKLGFLIAAVLVVGLASNAYAQKDRTLSGGFSLNAVIGVPSSQYGLDKAEFGDGYEDFKTGSLLGIQFGNRWYFSPQESMGFGLMINWFDFTYSAKTGNTDGFDWARLTMDFGFAEIGPVGTWVVGDGMAVDGYYNLRPTFLISGLAADQINYDFGTAGFGFSHALGAAFRFQALNVGVEYVLGGIKSAAVENIDGTSTTLDTKHKVATNSLRFVVGFKF
jgi:hypothetical protein